MDSNNNLAIDLGETYLVTGKMEMKDWENKS